METNRSLPPRLSDVSELAAALQGINGGIIALDGCLNAGKTTLLKDLGARLSCSSIDVDVYVHRRQGRYIAALRTDDLKAAIERALTTSKVVVVAGVCMRAVLDELALSAVFNVYVQRDAPLGPPYDYEVLDLEDAPIAEGTVPDEIDAVAAGAVHREVARYHARHCPRRNSDLIYAWIDRGD